MQDLTLAGFRSLAGRDEELGALDAAFTAASSGLGDLVVITGQPGIGKTALARTAAARAVAEGGLLLWGRCWEEGGTPAYWPWLQILRRLLRQPGSDELLEELGPTRAYLQRLLPELGGGISSAADPLEGGDDEVRRFALFDAVAELLVGAADHAPLVVVLDDVHAADHASLLLLQFVVRQLTRGRILVVATARDADLRLTGERRALLDTIAREGQRIRLQGLPAAAIAAMMQVRGVRRDPDLLTAIRDRTEGNPLFVDATLRVLAAQEHAGARHLPLASEVRGAVHERIALLREPVRRLVSVASVLGREFGVEDLARLDDAPELSPRLAEAVAAGVLAASGDQPGRHAFTHGLLREAAYELLDADERRRLHRRVADALREVDEDAHLAEIAHHLSAATAGGCSAEVVDYALRAARRALTSFAYEEAADQYARLLSLGTLEDDVRSDLLRELGAARRMAGAVRESKEAFSRALAVARTLGDPCRLAHCALALAGNPQERVIFQPETDLLREALSAVPERELDLRARLLARLSTSMLLGRAERRSLYDQATELAARADDLDTQVWVMRCCFSGLWWPDTVERRRAVARRLVELAPRSRQLDLLLVAHGERAVSALEAGDMPAFGDALQIYERLAAEYRRPDQRYVAMCMRATMAAVQGRYADAEREARDAYELARSRVGWAGYMLALGLLRPFTDTDRLDELLPLAEDLVSANPGNVTCEAIDALGRVAQGTTGHAVALLDRMTATGVSAVPEDPFWLTTLALLADLAVDVGHEGAAAALHDALEPYAGFYVVGSPGCGYLGSVDLRLADLAALLGRDADAERHAAEALRLERRVGAPAEALRAELRRGWLLLANGAAGETRELGDRLGAEAALLGATALQRAAAALSTAAGGASPTRRTEADDTPSRRVLRCEGDVWLVEFDGTTARVKASKGMTYLSVLLANPGQELHALAVVDAARGASVDGPAGRPDDQLRVGGDGGDLLDSQALAAYRRRLEELREDVDEADALGDSERSARASEEIEFLARELRSAVGLGGRARRSASPAERARISVTKAVRTAVARLAEVSPALGAHLTATIHTGTFCSYTPDPQASRWER